MRIDKILLIQMSELNVILYLSLINSRPGFSEETIVCKILCESGSLEILLLYTAVVSESTFSSSVFNVVSSDDQPILRFLFLLIFFTILATPVL